MGEKQKGQNRQALQAKCEQRAAAYYDMLKCIEDAPSLDSVVACSENFKKRTASP